MEDINKRLSSLHNGAGRRLYGTSSYALWPRVHEECSRALGASEGSQKMLEKPTPSGFLKAPYGAAKKEVMYTRRAPNNTDTRPAKIQK